MVCIHEQKANDLPLFHNRVQRKRRRPAGGSALLGHQKYGFSPLQSLPVAEENLWNIGEGGLDEAACENPWTPWHYLDAIEIPHLAHRACLNYEFERVSCIMTTVFHGDCVWGLIQLAQWHPLRGFDPPWPGMGEVYQGSYGRAIIWN